MKKILIVGAGIAGAVAYGAFRSHSPVVFDAMPYDKAGLSSHKAIMRLRSPEIGILTGCRLQKVTIQKSVLFQNKLLDKSNITTNNLYSMKAYGIIDDKSISDLGKSDRWLMEEKLSIPNVNYNHKLVGLENNIAVFITESGARKEPYDFIISTVPMPTILGITNLYDIKFDFIPIKVKQINLSINSKVNQTIYVPELKYSTYRVSLEFKKLIFEGVDEITSNEVEELISYFGIDSSWLEEPKEYTQKIGKMLPIDEEVRKAIIYTMTNEFNLFSFGRFAIWKPIRTDHLLQDIELINKLMRSSEYMRKYDSKKI